MLRVGPECLLRLHGKAVQSGGITRRDRFRGTDIFRENPPHSLAQRHVSSRKTVGRGIDPCERQVDRAACKTRLPATIPCHLKTLRHRDCTQRVTAASR